MAEGECSSVVCCKERAGSSDTKAETVAFVGEAKVIDRVLDLLSVGSHTEGAGIGDPAT